MANQEAALVVAENAGDVSWLKHEVTTLSGRVQTMESTLLQATDRILSVASQVETMLAAATISSTLSPPSALTQGEPAATTVVVTDPATGAAAIVKSENTQSAEPERRKRNFL